MKQEEIGMSLIMLARLIEFYDDGSHNDECDQLMKMTVELAGRLSLTNQLKFLQWLEKKTNISLK